MRTTLDISENLLRRIRSIARRENLTLKQHAQEGFELVLKARERAKPYQAKPVVFRGKGLAPEFQQASWSDIRKAIYDEQGR
jgi:hypothetical protein